MEESEKDKLMMKGGRDRESVCVCIQLETESSL